ncbi:MAG: SDR family NAD(P)-dependent oxidoreductase [Muribaculaceae bacterium]|nr:SDR family NAD(P)-dependent oxidoreductase [Muribaculaceae bacterium]
MDRRMEKRHIAIVTGADGGIGMEYCRALARRGYSLVMVSVTETPLREASERIVSEWGVVTWPVTMDLTLAKAPGLLVGWLDSTGLMPDVEVLVNNAGIFSFDFLTETPEKRVDTFVDLHVRSVAQMCRLFGARFAMKGSGYILNMSSMSCWMPMPGLALYASTKAFLRVFSRSLALELRDSGVRVMVAAPGGVATSLFGLPPKLMRLAVGLGVVARPEKFAERAVARLLKGKQQYINGLLNRISIVAVGCTPTWVRMQVKHRLLDRGIRKP